MADADAVEAGEFASAMAMLGPFEAGCHLAVAVSGGPDSLALAWLAGRWAGERNASVLALTVDHGLRDESAGEAVRVRDWLAGMGIETEILTRIGARPPSRVQQIAREERYALLLDSCRRHRILHLLLGHHRGDQRETIQMRALRAHEGDGLAGMAAVREVHGLRLLRPLLAFGPDRLRATLEAIGQPWIDDPSNIDRRFERVRARRAEGAATLPPTADNRSGRRAREAARATSLAALLRPHPWGYVELALSAAAGLPERQALVDLLRRCLWTVSGAPHPPRVDAATAIADGLIDGRFRGRTLAGCVIRRRSSGILIAREPRAAERAIAAPAIGTILWDGRFRIAAEGLPPTASIGALGSADLAILRRRPKGCSRRPQVPALVLSTLPAVRVQGGVVAIGCIGDVPGIAQLAATWTPRQALAAAVF